MEAWKTCLQVIAACALVSSSFKGQGSTDTHLLLKVLPD